MTRSDQVAAEMTLAWELFEAEQRREQDKADAEALRGDCGQQMYEPCGCPLYECRCDEYEGTPDDALTDFVDSWSPIRGVALPWDHEDYWE